MASPTNFPLPTATLFQLACDRWSERCFELKIAGLRADASGVGDGNDITATVKVNGTAVGAADMKVAGVATGLDPVVKVAKGRECDGRRHLGQGHHQGRKPLLVHAGWTVS